MSEPISILNNKGERVAVNDLTHETIGFDPHRLSQNLRTLPKEPDPTSRSIYEEMAEGKQARLTLDNGLKLSVIFGRSFYSNGVDTYEALETADSDTPAELLLRGDHDPRGHLSIEELRDYIRELAARQPAKIFRIVVRETTLVTYEVRAATVDEAEQCFQNYNRTETHEELIDSEIVVMQEKSQ